MALDAICVICLFHFKLCENLTPKYFADFTCCSVCPWRLYVYGIGCLLFDTVRMLHFVTLNSICHLDSHICRRIKSLLSVTQSSTDDMVLYEAVSSANRATLD